MDADVVFHVFMRGVDEFIDAAYGVDTRRERRYDPAAAGRTRHGDPATNMPSYYLRLLALRRFLHPNAGDVVLDLGCGDGRALCVFARRPVRRVRGIEFDATACAIARQNVAQLRRRRAPVEVIEGDAAEHRFTDETIVFLFNPFGPATLRTVLRNLRASLSDRPRRVRLCYYHPRHGEVLDAAGWLRQSATLRGLKTDVVIYEGGAAQ
jgi:SAM-dependent methyltransferase